MWRRWRRRISGRNGDGKEEGRGVRDEDGKKKEQQKGLLAINASHKESSPSLMGSTLLENTRRGCTEGERKRRRWNREREKERVRGREGEEQTRGCPRLDQPERRRH